MCVDRFQNNYIFHSFPRLTLGLGTVSWVLVRLQHGGQEEGVAADHHVNGGEWEEVLGRRAPLSLHVHQLHKVPQGAQEVLVLVAVPGAERERKTHTL